jgi:hypothetical protein
VALIANINDVFFGGGYVYRNPRTNPLDDERCHSGLVLYTILAEKPFR